MPRPPEDHPGGRDPDSVGQADGVVQPPETARVPDTEDPAARVPDAEDPARVVLDADEMARALARMAHQVLEANHGAADLLVLGIPTRGVPLAERLADLMAAVEGRPVARGQLDVTMYRDDLRSQPTRAVGRTVLPGTTALSHGVDGAVVVLVDDVLYSGRTVVAALDALGDLGRPAAVRLAVLVDRGHRQVPVRADHVGKNLPTAGHERVQVRLRETDGTDDVRISQRQRPGSRSGR